MYRSLQACRGLAALLVVFYHARGAIIQPKYFGHFALDRIFIFGGSAGVDFFFVLSGFIIFWIHGKDIGEPQRLGGYLARRAIRIYPTYWIIFAAVLCASLALPALRQSMPTDPWTILKGLLLIPMDPSTPGVTTTGAPVLTVAWSLQYEILFYAFVALAILAPFASLLVAGLWALNFSTCLGGCSFPLSFLADDRVLLFALGGATAWLCRVTGSGVTNAVAVATPVALARARAVKLAPWVERLALLLGLLLLVSAAAWQATGSEDLSRAQQAVAVACYGIASALLIFGAAKSEDRGVVYGGGRYWQLLGGASYVLYLLHYPLVSLVMKVMTHVGLHGSSGAYVALATATVAAVALAVVFHLRVERPMLRALGSWRWRTLGAVENTRV
ncbi:acyltransferase [Paraburkholderia sp. DHOC27]|uniref:acyltransferase family protein n=1 Tax=Paraburkholderia sp. DHOC27 TaxID=2303330 RepID=UPI000E3E7FBD|nr:acyltransferase [Paraburkholderia sp. DHOC27]RFU47897.1 acyltransferase [Paraburkholderia sp. DHOC27]